MSFLPLYGLLQILIKRSAGVNTERKKVFLGKKGKVFRRESRKIF